MNYPFKYDNYISIVNFMNKLTGTDKAVVELEYVHENVGYVHKTAKQTIGIKPHLHYQRVNGNGTAFY